MQIEIIGANSTYLLLCQWLLLFVLFLTATFTILVHLVLFVNFILQR